MSATTVDSTDLKPNPRMSYREAADYWKRQYEQEQRMVASLRAHLREKTDKLEAMVDELQAKLDVYEQDKGELKIKADEHDQIVDLLTDYRIFGWIDRLNDALALATGERAV